MSTFYHKVIYIVEDELGKYTLVEKHSFVWNGPVALCKKGRGEAKQITQAEQQQMADQAARQAAEENAANSTISQFETQGQPGQLSPAAAAQFASDMDNINRTYNGMRQTAFRSMGTRGFGSAPSGFSLAAQNGINEGQAEAGTGAFRNAQTNTQNLLDTALNARMGLSGQNLSGTNAAANTALNGAVAQSKMGSTLGDIGSAITAVPSMIGGVLGLPKAFASAFRTMGGSGSLPYTNPNNPNYSPYGPNFGG